MTDPQLPSTPLQGGPQLTNCDREPVHIPGSVQPYGALIAADRNSGMIQYVSQNVQSFIGLSTDQLLSQSLDSCLKQLLPLQSQVEQRGEGVSIAQTFTFVENFYSVSAHLCDQNIIFEWEPCEEPVESEIDLLPSLFSKLHGIGLEEVYQTIVDEIRHYAGFDRVMLYQFMEDGHGVVAAEAKEEELEPFLGLHYPASDIPQPARRLYELNWLRQIADVQSEPVPIMASKQQSEQPLNLTYARLRAISPIHIEYLKNMKVGASMSVSIMDGQKLWGLIACHHYSPKRLGGKSRDACELAGSVLSAYLTTRRQQEYLHRQSEIGEAIAKELTKITNFDDIEAGLERSASTLCQLIEADGMVWQSSEDLFCWGEVPNQLSISKVVAALDARHDEKLAYTDHLSSWLDFTQRFSDRCAGLLAIRMGQREAGLLIFFRRPYLHTINWGGDPNKSVVDEDGRLTPRKSFDAWKETIADRSLPWTRANLETARLLASGLQTMLVEQSSRLRRVNEELRRLNTDLDAFAYAASHDLKEPLRGLHHYVYLLENTPGDDIEFQSSIDGLKRILKRMSDLLDGLLRFSRAGRSELQIETFQLSEIVDQAKDILFTGQIPANVSVEVKNDATLEGDFACVREIVMNLISNGIKYNEQENKSIVVGTQPVVLTPLRRKVGEPTHAIYVKDNGIGIAPEHLSQIFDIFTRLHDRDAYGGGSGAGLTIVRRLVERHGGTVVAESDDDGSTFYFCLGEFE